MLREHPSADALVRLAVDKRYQAIWNDIDDLAKSGFKASIDWDVADAAEAAKQTPDDFGVVTRHIRALRVAGKPDQAALAGKALSKKKDRIEASGDSAFWFVNEYAYALAEAGQVDEAIAEMEGLLALGVDTYPSLVSQAINRAEMLNQWGKSSLALTAYNEVEEKYSQHASLFGKMWIWAGKACALRELNRGVEAEAVERKLAEKPEENSSAIIRAAACRGDLATIETQLMGGLDNPEKRNDILGELIRFEVPDAPSAFAKKLRQVVEAARSKPAVQSKFKEYGRTVSFAGARIG